MSVQWLKVLREVTVIPKIGMGHVLVSVSATWTCMERFGVVEEEKRPIWGGVADFELDHGNMCTCSFSGK